MPPTPEAVAELIASLKKVFGAEQEKQPRHVRKIFAEALVLHELQKRGIAGPDTALNVGDEDGPNIILKNGVKIAVVSRELDTTLRGVMDFSIKKRKAYAVDVVVCYDVMSFNSYLFLRREVRNIWMDGAFYYNDDAYYFYPWKDEEEGKAYCEKTRAGRIRTWGRVFLNKERILDSVRELVKVPRENFLNNWDKAKRALPEDPDKYEREKMSDEELSV